MAEMDFNAMDFESLKTLFSVCASITALLSTALLWLVRFNREQPNLAVEQVSPLKAEFVVPHHFADLYQALRPAKHEGLMMMWTDIAVINNSTLPNAILELEASVKLADGTWQSAHVQIGEKSQLPINLPPHSTGGIPVVLAIKRPFELAGTGNRERVELAVAELSPNREIRIRVRGVKNTAFNCTLRERSSSVERNVVPIEPMRRSA